MLGAWEFWILDGIQEAFGTPFLDQMVPALTRLGNGGFIWILLGVALLCHRPWRRAGVMLLLALAIEALLCNLLLKNLVAAPRPFALAGVSDLLIPAPEDFSFPSGHTGAAFAAVWALYWSHFRGWGVALVLAVLIAFSRLYLYVHFPSDILGGIAVGILSAWLARVLVRRYEGRRREN